MKTITYTTMHFITAFSVAWLLTGDLVVGGLVAVVEPAVNSAGYVIHERLWRRHAMKKERVAPPGAKHCLAC